MSFDYGGSVYTLNEFLARTTTLGFLVLRDGRIMSEQYYFGANADSVFTSWSVAKSFISALVGAAIEDGSIDGVSRPIVDYVPELRGSGYDHATIEDVLQMSSGVEFNEDYDDVFSDVSRMYFMSFLFGSRINAVPSRVGTARPAGQHFDYVSVNTQALAMLLTRVTGKSVAEYLEEKIWWPVGMERDAHWITDRPGVDAMEYGFCCLNATLRDYAKFGQLFLQSGEWNGVRVLPAEWVQNSTVPDKPYLRLTGTNRPEWATLDWDIGYQYQWWVPNGRDGEFVAIGVWGQYIYVNRADKVVIVKMSADPDFDHRDMETIAAFRAVAASLHSEAQ